MICPNCSFNSPAGMLFCGNCGVQLGSTCPTCGFINPLTFNFCGMCGTRLVREMGVPSLELTAPVATAPVNLEKSPSQAAELPEAEALDIAPPSRSVLATPKMLVGERRIATVILADVRSSTDLLERLGTEAWVEIMNRVFQILETEIYRFGGHIDQFRGDGLVAFFGAAGAHEDDPERAVLAGLAMQRAMQDYANDLNQQIGIELKLRVGINTGEIIVTSIGDRSQHWEDTAMGEAIAIASRMETAAEPGTVLVSANTYQMVDNRFRWLELGEIMVKGVSTPITVYRPLEHLTTSDYEPRGLDFCFTTSLTGRTVEFQLLTQSIEDLYGGRGGIAIVSGETGLGKSFIVSKVREHFDREEILRAEAHQGAKDYKPDNGAHPRLNWLTGNCRSYDQSWPYSLWLDMLQKWLNVLPDENAEIVNARLYQESEKLWGDALPEYYPYLAKFLSLPMEEAYNERVRHLSAESLQRQFRQAIRSWIEKLSQRGPTVVVLNDIHWADASALGLLRFCLPLADSQALLWVMTMRPDRTSKAWELRHHVATEYPHRLVTVDLQPLAEAQISELLTEVVGSSGISDETRQLIIKKSDGNPYYVQELVRTLISQGALVLDTENSRYHETRAVANLNLPDSLQSLVLARIDRTSPEERRVLQVAAVVGQVFWLNLLEHLTGQNGNLKVNLTSLQRSELISERSLFSILGMEYEFNSTLIREVAYESLLSSQRNAYHMQAANFLEESTGLEGWAQYYSLIAYHYRCAGFQRKELFYTLLAAEQALKIYANAEAYQDYTNALKLLDQMEIESQNEDQRYVIWSQRFEVLKGRGELSYTMGNIQSGDADLRALLPLANQMSDDLAWKIDALLMQPEVSRPDTHTLLRKALGMALEALGLAQQIGDYNRELKALMACSVLQLLLHDPQVQSTNQRALDLSRQLGDRAAEARLLLAMGSASGMDNLQQQQTFLEAALAISNELQDRKQETHLLHLIGEQFERTGDYYRQLKEYEEKRLRICQEIGDRLAEAHALLDCGQIQGIYLGDYAHGMPMVEQSAQIWEEMNDRIYPLLRLAQMKIERRHFKEARNILEVIRPTVEQSILDVGRVGHCMVWAMLNNAQGGKKNLQAALESTGRILQMTADNLVSRQYQIAASCQASLSYLRLAHLASSEEEKRDLHLKALQASGQALDLYRYFGFVRISECVSEEVLYRHGMALDANGQKEEGAEFIKQAYAEMMRKHSLIPEGSPFRKSYLENIRLHKTIQNLVER